MKILWDSGNIGFGGCGINEWDKQVVTHLRSKGHEVTIIVDQLLKKRPEFKKWRPPTGGYTYIDEKITPENYRSVVQSLGDFDVQVGNHFTMFPVCENILPVVHDVEIKGRQEYSQSIELSLRGLGTIARNFACTTPFIEEQVASALPHAVTKCLYAGSKFASVEAIEREPYSGEPYIAYWGNRYSKEKNFQSLLKSLTMHPLNLKVSGFLPPSDRELQLVDSLGLSERVEFHTALSDEELKRMVMNASMYVCPSLYEGMGLPVMEAISLGVPVVSTPCAALPSIVSGCGFIAEGKSAKALAAAINKSLSNPDLAKSYVQAGLSRAQDWTWDNTVEGLLSLVPG